MAYTDLTNALGGLLGGNLATQQQALSGYGGYATTVNTDYYRTNTITIVPALLVQRSVITSHASVPHGRAGKANNA